uniref:Uncharacterized protein n=1 Tax=Aegilops tauschii TaxID=37682 RepID=N1QYC6_AEGTA
MEGSSGRRRFVARPDFQQSYLRRASPAPPPQPDTSSLRPTEAPPRRPATGVDNGDRGHGRGTCSSLSHLRRYIASKGLEVSSWSTQREGWHPLKQWCSDGDDAQVAVHVWQQGRMRFQLFSDPPSSYSGECSSDSHRGFAALPRVACGLCRSSVQPTIGSSTAASPRPVALSSMVWSTRPEYAAAHISSGCSSWPANVQFWQPVFARLAHVLPTDPCGILTASHATSRGILLLCCVV